MKKLLFFLYVTGALFFCNAVLIDNDILRAVSKPLPLIILLLSIKPNTKYAKLIFAGFLFSLAGDVFLMKIVDKFIFGLAAFLIAHIFYIFAFIGKDKRLRIIDSVPFYALAALLALFFSQYTKEMTVPVIVYIIVIVTMAWRSYVQRNSSRISKFAFYGAVLFVFSDANIAFTKFYSDYEYSKIVTIILYWTAQFLIAKSVGSFILNKKD